MTIWNEHHFRLFLSHTAEHKKIATQLKIGLTGWHIDIFVAHTDIEPTLPWLQEIEGALASMDGLAALLTPDFHNSEWTDHEVGWALGRGLLVLPLRHGIDPYGLFGKYQAYTITDKPYTTIASEITNILIKHPLSSARMAPVIISLFENSSTWDSAKSIMSKIELIPHLSLAPDLLARIEKATTENYQIQRAFGVPERVREFIARVLETWKNINP